MSNSQTKKISYDDTRDIAINLVEALERLGFIKPDMFDDDDDTHFEILDTIQEAINEKLGIDIDDNFEISIS